MAYVLVVDDDQDFADAAATALRDDGHEVAIELDIEGATASMEAKRPDLVVLDVMFPENACAGFELARHVQHHNEKLKGIPILMLTAVNTKFPLGFSSRDIDKDWLPVTDFLEKPVSLELLREKATALLEAAESAQDD